MGYHDDGEEVLGVAEDSSDGIFYIILSSYGNFLTMIITVAKRRLREQGRIGDSKVAKKARMLAEATSAGQKGSILRHLQTGPGVQKQSAKESARKFTQHNTSSLVLTVIT